MDCRQPTTAKRDGLVWPPQCAKEADDPRESFASGRRWLHLDKVADELKGRGSSAETARPSTGSTRESRLFHRDDGKVACDEDGLARVQDPAGHRPAQSA